MIAEPNLNLIQSDLPVGGMGSHDMRTLLDKYMQHALGEDLQEGAPILVPTLTQCAKLIRDTVTFNNGLHDRVKGDAQRQSHHNSEIMNSDEERERVARDFISRIIARHNAALPEGSPDRVHDSLSL